MITIIVMVAVLVWVWYDWLRPQPKEKLMPEKPMPIPQRTYECALMHPDGTFVGTIETPGLPRHIFACAGGRGFLSDKPEPPEDGAMAFDRVGSAVHVDDDRVALFVRRV